MKKLKSTIFIFTIFLSLLMPYHAYASVYSVRGSEKPGEVVLGNLKNGESMEFEFKLIEVKSALKIPKGNSEMDFVIKQPELGDARIIIKPVSGRWTLFFYPPGSDNYARKYYTYLPVNEDGKNRIRIERKEDWITMHCNNVMLGSVPVKNKSTASIMHVYNMEKQYQWISRKYDKSTAKNPVSVKMSGFSQKKPASSRAPVLGEQNGQIDTPGGYFTVVDSRLDLNDNEKFQLEITVQELHRHEDWSNSIVFQIDDSAVWLNERYGVYEVKFQTYYDSKINEPNIKFNKKKNIIELTRKKDKIYLTVNGLNAGYYNIDEDSLCHVVLRFVGLKARYNVKKYFL